MTVTDAPGTLPSIPGAPTPAAPMAVGRARWAWSTGGLLVLLVVTVVLGLVVGSRELSVAELWAAARGEGSVEARAILLGQRVPRTVLAVAGGAALAVAGVVIQGHTRNPLADPGLIGVTAGAGVAVVIAIAVFGVTRPAGFLWFALGGAAVTAATVMTLARVAGGRRDSSPATLVLAGTAVSAVLSAISGVVLLLSAATLDVFRFWTVGSLSGAQELGPLLPAFGLIAAGLLVALAHAGTLDALALGDDTARSLGRDLGRSRLVGLATVTLLAGGAVACCGSLGFVGLIAPHLVRRLTGPGHRYLVPASAVLGAVLVLVADTLGRVIVSPAEMPVGVVLAIVGAPVFLLIVVRTRRSRTPR